MKRTGMISVIFALLATIIVTPAGAAKTSPVMDTRRAVATYAVPTIGSASRTGGAACLPCPTFEISKKERWVKVGVHDDASPAPVAFDIRQRSSDGDCCEIVAGPFCGSTGKRPIQSTPSSGRPPVRITPGLDVLVFVYASGDVACPGAVGTTGSVTAVFSNAP